MGREQRQTTIDGVGYRVTQLGAREQVKLFRRLAAAADFMGVFGRLANVEDEALGAEILGAAVGKLARTVSDEDLDAIIRMCSKEAQYQPSGSDKWPQLEGDFDGHFSGSTLRMFKFLGFAIQTNFADFFHAWSGSDVAAALQARLRSPSQTASSTTAEPPAPAA